MNKVVRIKTIAEIELFNTMSVDVFCIDTTYSAKRIATFTIEEINEIVQKAHESKKHVYAYVNIMVHEDQIKPLKEYLLKLNNMRIDGIIINDMTVFVLARELEMEHLIIYQPGTMNTDSYSVEYFEQRNIMGITISREITLDEIKKITSKKNTLQMSLIGHGYLDMFYSKRKLLTNYAVHKGINGEHLIHNYDLRLNEEIRKEEFYPILEDGYGTHIFRSNKLISIDELSELMDDIDDFFIERIFLEDEEYFDSVRLYSNMIEKGEFLNKYRHFDSGFYYQRTEKRKGELDEN